MDKVLREREPYEEMDKTLLGQRLGQEKHGEMKWLLKYNFTLDASIEKKLISNRFYREIVPLDADKVKTIHIPDKDNLYFYLEREDEMYHTRLDNILDFIGDMEPWDEIDAYIFDEDCRWVIVFTHNENWFYTDVEMEEDELWKELVRKYGPN